MRTPNILVVEDEKKIARVLELELEYEGYKVTKAHDGMEGLRLFREEEWDLVLLDVMLPELGGTELLKRLRSGEDSTPVIMLTAKDAVEDKVTGLDLGANDYVTKPFDIEELLARIRAALRTKPVQQEVEEMRIADLTVNERTHEVKRGRKNIELTAKEFSLLVYLMKHKRQVLNREQLLEGVWGYDYYGDTNIVDVYIRYLRNKMDKGYEPKLIQTVRGVGYVMKDPR
ncbi:DNA-binding response regulator, OmpR family, contains REC and winged-helix (wHTH) domain [Halobacillus karajensis]|uniref:Mycobacterial persistence regulator A n=1 Tax=Halobacillus karajensis TaxID=195088 RepID=A0A024P4M2_9BACI|nr:response regulator transcription factor [Halobacillus karajensis]CDQ19155.1 Mycobacterial persistence regulator A [Halobacillus karajensis]CDQ22771.1 Mycobacterial persistence regulator A [Halobacillus karajensis]CDQ26253.1 Mycobacterial persistence regulator A [Halobacillus karajensis]SEH40778.1 DNA-binding response regulator, OmpR family, contains REC and winged-helix (wHTH) domain [Halobacillus karajensis]